MIAPMRAPLATVVAVPKAGGTVIVLGFEVTGPITSLTRVSEVAAGEPATVSITSSYATGFAVRFQFAWSSGRSGW